MTSLRIIIFSKAHDGKHYLDNQSEDSSKGYLCEKENNISLTIFTSLKLMKIWISKSP